MNEAQRIKLNAELPCKEALKKIFKQALLTIRVAATLRKDVAIFKVPAICIDFPVQFDHAKMVRSVVKLLVRQGYSVDVKDNCLTIAWPLNSTSIS